MLRRRPLKMPAARPSRARIGDAMLIGGFTFLFIGA
jgi:hypothetical protein